MKYRNRVGKELLRVYEVDGINLDYCAMVRNSYIVDAVSRMSPDFVVLSKRKSEVLSSQMIYNVHDVMLEAEYVSVDVTSFLEEINGPPRPQPFMQHECVVLRVSGIKAMLELNQRQMYFYQSRFMV